MEYVLESVVRFAIIASSEENAVTIAKEAMTDIQGTLSEALIYEWDDPVVKSVGEQGPVKIMDERGAHPENLNRAVIIQKQLGKEWSGHPDPRDPDNFWIDDKTGERVNAATGERTETTFAGYHKFRHALTHEEYGSFEVFFADGKKEGTMELEKGWYWWACSPGCLPDSDGEPANGPFPDSEGAYLDALEGG